MDRNSICLERLGKEYTPETVFEQEFEFIFTDILLSEKEFTDKEEKILRWFMDSPDVTAVYPTGEKGYLTNHNILKLAVILAGRNPDPANGVRSATDVYAQVVYCREQTLRDAMYGKDRK